MCMDYRTLGKRKCTSTVHVHHVENVQYIMLHVVCGVNEYKNNEQTATTSSSIIMHGSRYHDHMMAHLRLCLDLPLFRALTSTETEMSPAFILLASSISFAYFTSISFCI